MIDDFYRQHAALGFVVTGILLMISGRLDSKFGAFISANFNWLLGGVLGVGALTYWILENADTIGNVSKALAVIVLLGGICGVWAYRPKK